MPSANFNPDDEIWLAMTGSGKIIAAGVAALGVLCGTSLAAAASTTSSAGGGERTVAGRILAVHNAERSRLGVPALRWNAALERDARGWAEHLSRRGVLQHADQDEAGENLWMGSSGHWPVEDMVGMFVGEKKHFRPGAFPNISRTGNWYDVGHYSQVIWRDTREVGCAVATGKGNDVMVCRYYPAGNVWGQKAY